MKQINLAPKLAPLAPPTCDDCGRDTRLVGLESALDNFGGDLCTYECNACSNVQTRVFQRASNQNER